jgi:hypothetical protein
MRPRVGLNVELQGETSIVARHVLPRMMRKECGLPAALFQDYWPLRPLFFVAEFRYQS